MSDDLHLDLDALADALAGEADAAATAHLAGCPSCTSRLTELQAAEVGVVAALAALPDPPLPPGLAERLSAALAAEAPLAPAPAQASVTALPQRARERRPQRRLLSAAAAGVLLASGAGLGYALLSDGGTTSEDASTAGGTTYAITASGTDWADAGAVEGALPGVLSGAAGATALDSAPEAAGATGATAESGARGSAGSPPADAAITMQAPAADPLERLRTPEGLADCLVALAPPEEPDLQPRALDYALYQGQPALAVLLPDPDPEKVSVYVVGPTCSQADAAVLAFFRADAP